MGRVCVTIFPSNRGSKIEEISTPASNEIQQVTNWMLKKSIPRKVDVPNPLRNLIPPPSTRSSTSWHDLETMPFSPLQRVGYKPWVGRGRDSSSLALNSHESRFQRYEETSILPSLARCKSRRNRALKKGRETRYGWNLASHFARAKMYSLRVSRYTLLDFFSITLSIYINRVDKYILFPREEGGIKR